MNTNRNSYLYVMNKVTQLRVRHFGFITLSDVIDFLQRGDGILRKFLI